MPGSTCSGPSQTTRIRPQPRLSMSLGTLGSCVPRPRWALSRPPKTRTLCQCTHACEEAVRHVAGLASYSYPPPLLFLLPLVSRPCPPSDLKQARLILPLSLHAGPSSSACERVLYRGITVAELLHAASRRARRRSFQPTRISTHSWGQSRPPFLPLAQPLLQKRQNDQQLHRCLIHHAILSPNKITRPWPHTYSQSQSTLILALRGGPSHLAGLGSVCANESEYVAAEPARPRRGLRALGQRASRRPLSRPALRCSRSSDSRSVKLA